MVQMQEQDALETYFEQNYAINDSAKDKIS